MLHAKLVAERNHARREELVVDAQVGTHLAGAIEAARRGKLEVVFRKLRKGQAIDAYEREALIGELVPLIDTP
jgi:hypothetical protein